jgi:hypothetical protein
MALVSYYHLLILSPDLGHHTLCPVMASYRSRGWGNHQNPGSKACTTQADSRVCCRTAAATVIEVASRIGLPVNNSCYFIHDNGVGASKRFFASGGDRKSIVLL